MRLIVEDHRGWLFKHTGDGVCAVFASPRSAIEAAVAAQRDLELPVRMGIATGEAELRGEDYFGAVLNRAARVMAAGHGGQILLDGATAELCSPASTCVDLGPRRLRDIAKPVEISQVRAPGLRDRVPAADGRSTPRREICGRRAPASSAARPRLAEMRAALKAHRLVTLTGVGGVGKTRLALEVAARLGTRFPDGVWVIELAPVGDPAAVPDAVAAVLGITQQPGMTMAESVAAALEGGRGCWCSTTASTSRCGSRHDRGDPRASATVDVLATSREGLRLPDEQLWPVPSLDVDGADSCCGDTVRRARRGGGARRLA